MTPSTMPNPPRNRRERRKAARMAMAFQMGEELVARSTGLPIRTVRAIHRGHAKAIRRFVAAEPDDAYWRPLPGFTRTGRPIRPPELQTLKMPRRVGFLPSLAAPYSGGVLDFETHNGHVVAIAKPGENSQGVKGVVMVSRPGAADSLSADIERHMLQATRGSFVQRPHDPDDEEAVGL